MLGLSFSNTAVDNCIDKHTLKKNSYISCIKIGGVPILPPLITSEKQLEIQKYRREAIDIERRIKTRIEQKKLTYALNKTLENSLAFDSLALEVCDRKKPEQNLVPLTTKPSQLSCNIFDVTEYSDNGIILFNDFEHCDNNLNFVDLKQSSVQHSPTQPRLLRSNSYTLDAPSPILVEHFKKQIRESSGRKKESEDTQLSFASSNSSTNSISLESAVKKNLLLTTESVNEIIKGLASVHFGSNKCSEINYSSDLFPIMNSSKDFKNTSNSGDFGDVCRKQDITNRCNSHLDIGECLDTPTDQLNTSSVLLIDFESDTGENLTFCCDDSLSKGSIFDSDVGYSPSFDDKERRSCSRVLFADSLKSHRKLQEERAATILTAAVRGYLVRRLKRTERVRNLIQTIRDALLCAMSLHTEQTDAIQPPDVELHRRLIQQISAACYEFYDIFFNLTLKEKMEIIALDRQRIKDKLKRPSSALTVDSEKFDNSRKNSLSSKQKKTLVSSLVA